MQLPKSWLIHTIQYEQFLKGKDDYGNSRYDTPITINNVRFDNSTVFSRDGTEAKILANGVIFVDVINSYPVPTFTEQSKVIFNNTDMIIKKVVPCYYPEANAVRHYELEMI